MSGGQILLVPCCEPGRGGGHLGRAAALTRDLRAMGRDAWLYLDSQAAVPETFFNSMDFNPEWRITENEFENIDAGKFDFIVLDRFKTPREEFSKYRSLAPLIGIDEGGPCRESFDFLIDILLPKLRGVSSPNIANPSLLRARQRQQFFPKIEEEKRDTGTAAEATGTLTASSAFKVLVSFGREDSAGLGLAAARALSEKHSGGKLAPRRSAPKVPLCIDITLLKGGMGKNEITELNLFQPLPGVRIIEMIPNLGQHLADYNLIITHYGITAYEALYSGTPVLLVSPTPYHEKLAKAAGFYSAGIGKRGIDKLANLFDNPAFLREFEKKCVYLAAKYTIDKPPRQNLADLVNSFFLKVNHNCPVCGCSTAGTNVSRFIDRTYWRCQKCGIIYMDRTNPPPIEYGRDYFFELYKKQYGKTYIEDFPNLINMGKRRLGIIKSLLPNGRAELCSATLLDIGCAYGPFLAAAREEGFSPTGIDPAEDAVSYVQQTLGIQAVRGGFPDCTISQSRTYDIVTLWYVIEHFQNCVPVFAEIKKLLKPGGLLAFSTPSFSGASGRSSLRRFLSDSPADHWTIWSPCMCARALEIAGFSVKKIAITGHHPERFPLLGKFVKGKKSLLYRPLLALSKIFALGDTFEVYATLVSKGN